MAIKRAHTFTVTIGADTEDALAGALRCLETAFALGKISRQGISGGSSFDWAYEYEVDPAMTHDRYFELINAELAKATETPPTTDEGQAK